MIRFSAATPRQHPPGHTRQPQPLGMDARIAALWAAGATAPEIAAELGIERKAVYAARMRLKLRPRYTRKKKAEVG